MNRAMWPAVARAFRHAALPLASYYAVTLALPLANGAAQGAEFAEHALVVIVLPPILIVLACAARHVARRAATKVTKTNWPQRSQRSQG